MPNVALPSNVEAERVVLASMLISPDAAELARRIGPRAKAVAGSWEEIAREAAAAPERPLVIAVLGAGDLDAVFRYL